MQAGSRGEQRRACRLAYLLHTSGYSTSVLPSSAPQEANGSSTTCHSTPKGLVSCLRDVQMCAHRSICPAVRMRAWASARASACSALKPRCARWSTRWAWTTRRSALPGFLPSRICVIHSSPYQSCAISHRSAATQEAPERPALLWKNTRQSCPAAVLWHQCPLCGDRMDSGLQIVNQQMASVLHSIHQCDDHLAEQGISDTPAELPSHDACVLMHRWERRGSTCPRRTRIMVQARMQSRPRRRARLHCSGVRHISGMQDPPACFLGSAPCQTWC